MITVDDCAVQGERKLLIRKYGNTSHFWIILAFDQSVEQARNGGGRINLAEAVVQAENSVLRKVSDDGNLESVTPAPDERITFIPPAPKREGFRGWFTSLFV